MPVARPYKTILILLMFIGIFAVKNSHAQELLPSGMENVSGPVTISADRVIYYRLEDRYVTRGNVVLKTSRYTVRCAEIEVDNKTGEMEARGGVVLTGDETNIECESIRINRKTGEGVMVRGTLFIAESQTTIEAEKIERVGQGTYVIESASYTTCKCEEGEKPDWSVKAKKIIFKEEGYARTRRASFRIKDTPVLYFPALAFPVKRERQTGLLIPEIGYSSRNGFEFGLPFYVAAARWWDFTVTERFLHLRGVKQEIETRWIRRHGRKGELTAFYLDDWKKDENRWAFVYEGRIPLFAGIDWRQDFRWMSDNEYVRDFRDDDLVESRARSLESRMIIDRDFSWGGASLLFKYVDDLQGDDISERLYYSDSDENQPHRLPRAGLRSTLVKIPRLPFYFGARSSFDNFYRYSPDEATAGTDENLSQRADAYTFLTTTYVPYPGIYFTPEAGWRGTAWRYGNNDYGRWLAVGRSEVGMRAYRIYRERYKHTVEPRVRYVIARDVGSDLPPPTDMTDESGDFEAIDFNLDQHLLVRKTDKRGTLRGDDIVQFEITQRYTPDDGLFRMLRGQLGIRATDGLRLDADAYYKLHKGMFRYATGGFTFDTERGDRFAVSYRYQGEDDWQFLRNRAQVKITPAVALTYLSFVNISEERFVDHGGGILLTPDSECWRLRAEVIYHTDPDEIRYNLWVNLYGLGSAGSE